MFINRFRTFDNYGIGNNWFAYEMAKIAAENPGGTVDPLFIYGNAGVGKTHILNAIAFYMQARHRGKTIILLTGEQFVSGLIEALESGYPAGYRQRFAEADAVLIDDIDYLQNKETSQEELFNVMCGCLMNSKQFVATSHEPLSRLDFIKTGIADRFASGIIAEIPDMDYETKVSALKMMQESEGIEMPKDIIDHIAGLPDVNGWQLQGFINQFSAYGSIKKEDPTLDEVKTMLKNRML